MFSKLKVFFMTFVLCIGVFGITAFADSRALNLDDNPYYVTYIGNISGTTWLYTYESLGSNGVIYYYNCYKYVDGKYSLYESGLNSVFDSDSYKGFSTNDDDLYNYLVSTGVTINGSVSPPEIAPTVEEAIMGIVPGLSTQLKVLLPVGVILLSTMLGVSLVPRLVRSFL